MDIFLAHNTIWTLQGGQWPLQMAASYFSNNIQEITNRPFIFTWDEVTTSNLFKNFPFMSHWGSVSETLFSYLVFQEDTVLHWCIRGKFLVTWNQIRAYCHHHWFIPCIAKSSPLDEVSSPKAPGYWNTDSPQHPIQLLVSISLSKMILE